MSIEIIADGPSDLPLSYIKENNLTLIPHGVHLEDGDYQDRITIQPKELMDKMRAGAIPTTSQGPVNLILDAFTRIAKEKKQGIYIVFSSGLSGTFNTAVALKEQVLETYPDFQMEVIDSKSASIGLGLSVMACVEKVKQKATLAEVAATAKFYAENIEHLAVVNELTYLARGGRLKKSSAIIGGMLNVKPILKIEDGSLIPFTKIRGKKKIIPFILDYMEQYRDILKDQVIGIAHADNLEDALEMKNAISEKFAVKKFAVTEIGGAIGAHTGPGTYAVIFLKKLPE